MNLIAEFLTKDLKVNFNDHETEVFSDGANLWRGALSVGGKLLLTEKRLIFLPHNFNLGFGGKDEYINLADIHSAKRVKTTAIVDNGLRITLSDDTELKFVVNKREQWIEKLDAAHVHIIA